MAAFVLVHGSGQNAGCWSRVRALLETRGHANAAPDLPKKAADWALADYADRIADAVEGTDTVLVAHSFSGVFLPLVARRRQCARLVFFAAVVPEPGRSVREQFTADPAMFCPGWIEAGPRWFDESQVEDLAREFLFHDCDDDVLPWALETIEFYDTRRIVTEPSPAEPWPDVPCSYVVATADKTLSPDWGRRKSRDVLGVEPVEVAAGHCPHVSMPDRVADLLERAAAE